MAFLKFKKVNSVPGTLEANTIYIIKQGSNHVLYITDKDGTLSYKSYDSVDIAAVTSAYVTALIGEPNGIAGLDASGNLMQSASLNTYEVTLDFGSTPIGSKKFTIANASVNTNSKIFFTASASPAAGRQSDELEMDGLTCAAVCSVDGSFDVYITANPGPVSGQFKFNYFLG
jgi:hypothetical protein